MTAEVEADMGEKGILSAAQRGLAVAVVERIIPAEGTLPAGGRVGAVEAIERELGTAPVERRRFLDGLAAVGITAWQTGDAEFIALDAAVQIQVLQAVEAAHPEFFAFLVNRTYRAYYTHPAVLAALGADLQPPQPGGHTLLPFDPSLLAKARERGPIYRRIGDEG